MTILDVGRCLGSGEAPREGTEETADRGRTTGVCMTCSGRFEVEEDGRLVAHATAAADERESLTDERT